MAKRKAVRRRRVSKCCADNLLLKDQIKHLERQVSDATLLAEDWNNICGAASRMAVTRDRVEELLRCIQHAVVSYGPTTSRYNQTLSLLRWTEGRLKDNRDAEAKMLAQVTTRVSPMPIPDPRDDNWGSRDDCEFP